MKIRRNKILDITKIVFVVLMFYFLLQRLLIHWNDLQSYKFSIDWGYFVISLLLGIFFYLVAHFRWYHIIKFLGYNITKLKSLRIWIIAELTRYIPGTVWFFVGKIFMAEKAGVKKKDASLSVFLELIILTIATLLIVLIWLPGIDFGGWQTLILNKFSITMFIILGLIFIHPKMLKLVLNVPLKIVKKKEIYFTMSYQQMLFLIGINVFNWLIHGLSFFFLILAIYPIKLNLIFTMMAIFAAGWFIGLISFVAPGGLGVREAVIAFGLSFYMPAGVALVIALMSRIQLTALEAIIGGLILLFEKH